MTCVLKDLRYALQPYFSATETVLRRLREARLLPFGKSGHGGVYSAPVTERHAVICLLALASCAWADPVDSPSEALRLAVFKLTGGFYGRQPAPRLGTVTADYPHHTYAHLQPADSELELLDILSGELRATAGGISDFEPATWTIGEISAVRDGDPRLRFGPADFAATGELMVNRQTILGAELIGEIAALFKPVAVVPVTAKELSEAASLIMGQA